MKYALVLAVVAGAASSTIATTTMSILSSVNGGPFAPSNTVSVGDTVRVRVMVSTDLAGIAGLAGATYNISATNFAATNILAPWDVSGPSTDPLGPGVQDQVNGNGRIAPFAASAATSLPTSSLSAGVLTIGGSAAGRIATGQNAPLFAGSRFQTDNPVSIFQFTFTIGSGYNGGDSIFISVTNLLNAGTTGVRWYNNLAGSTAVNDPNPILPSHSLYFLPPAPGTLALLGLGGVVVGRRRR